MIRYETLRLEAVRPSVARLVLTRPDKHNALDPVMISELSHAATHLAADTGIRAVILAADGNSFCAGGDLSWMRGQIQKTRAERLSSAKGLSSMLQALDALPKPLIGRVHGNAFGGGVGLMSVCDIVVAAPQVKFALTETRLGLIPATIAPFVIRRIGEAGARRLMFHGRTFTAEEAHAIHLVSAITEDLDAAIDSEVDGILRCAPGAVAEAKRLCRHVARSLHESLYDWTAERLADRWETEEAAEGIASFFEHRKARWNS